MKRIAWMNQILAVWLFIFIVFGVGDSGSLLTIANDGTVGLLLLLSSWRVLAELPVPVSSSWLQVFCGIWLGIAPFVLGYRLTSLPAWNDVIVGSIVLVVSLIETWAVARTTPGAEAIAA